MRTIAGAILLLAGALLLSTGLLLSQSGRTDRGALNPAAEGAYLAAGMFGVIGLMYLLLGPSFDKPRRRKREMSDRGQPPRDDPGVTGSSANSGRAP